MSAAERGQLIHKLIGDMARAVGKAEAAEIERRVLSGENDITVPSKTRPLHGMRVVVPSPWRHPIRRARLGLARRRFRAFWEQP